MRTQWIVGSVIVLVLLVGGVAILLSKERQPGELDSFASCLKDKGAVFYGAFWCPHCQNQKKLFGDSEDLLPYVECSTPDGNRQLSVCQEKNIQGYPTWVFTDGSRVGGEMTLSELAEKTSCALPAEQP